MIHSIARAVIIKDDNLLVCINRKGSYFLPGGHVEQGEDVAAALHRELREELGSTGNIQRFLGCFESSSIADNPHVCHDHEYKFLYLVELPSLSSRVIPQSPEAGTVFAWVPLKDLQVVDFRPVALKKVLCQWLETDYTGALVNSKSSSHCAPW